MTNLRIERAIMSVDRRLRGWVPGARRRQIRSELRQHLAATAQEVGPDEAVRRLGDVRQLAAEYLETERGRINVRGGGRALMLAVYAVLLIWTVGEQSFREGYKAAGSTARKVSWGPLSWEGDPALGYASWSFMLAWPVTIGVLVVAFVLGSRAWRLLLRR